MTLHRKEKKEGRSRARNVDNWAKVTAKKKCNLDQEYVSYATKNVMEARKVGPPCKDGCFDKLWRQKTDHSSMIFGQLETIIAKMRTCSPSYTTLL